MSSSWICDGVPKDGKSYSNTGPHEPYENYGPDCVICGLPKNAILEKKGRRSPIASPWLKFAAIGILSAFLAAGGGFIVSRLSKNRSPCPEGQQRVGGVCQEDPNSSTLASSPSGFYSSFADVPEVPQGIHNYGGSTTHAPLRAPEIVAQIERAHPDYKLRYTEPLGGKKPGSGTGIRMLIDGQLSFSQSSRRVKTKEFEEAKTRNFQLKEIPIAIDGIAAYVNPEIYDSGLQELTIAQLRQLFAGEIKNWQEVGGPDREVALYSRPLDAGGTVDFFYEAVLGKTDFASNLQEMRDTTDALRKVGSDPGGIGYATASEVVNQRGVRVLSLARDERSPFISPCEDSPCTRVDRASFADDSYPITRRLFVVVKEDRGLDQQAGEAFANLMLSDEGQVWVEQKGFVPIRK